MGVVILNWRRPDDVLATLASVGRLRYPCIDTVVVDNGSQNSSVQVIRERFPWATVIENGRNLGFAAGSNVGIAHHLGRGAPYVFLLNDDTEVAPDLLSRLVSVAEADPSIGIVGPTIYFYDPHDVVWCAGGAVTSLGEPRHLHGGDRRGALAPLPPLREVDYVSGCGLLVRSAAIQVIGSLDERFFAYFEETEWCARTRAAGFRVIQARDASMWHKIPTADRATSPVYVYLMTRNRLLFLRCTGAPSSAVAGAATSMLRGAASRWIRRDPKAEPFDPRPVLRGIGDFARGRFGPPPDLG